MSDYQNILVAVDFSPVAKDVINKALAVARNEPTKLQLIHVVEYLPPIDIAYEPVLTSSWVIDENELVENARKALHELCVKYHLENTAQTVVVGIPKHEISKYAREHQCDLIILGSHGRHGLERLLGSTANGVLQEMPCDVLALKVRD